MLLMKIQLLEHGYVLYIAENLGLGFLAELETDSEEVLLFKTHEVGGRLSGSCGRTGGFAVDPQIPEVTSSV